MSTLAVTHYLFSYQRERSIENGNGRLRQNCVLLPTTPGDLVETTPDVFSAGSVFDSAQFPPESERCPEDILILYFLQTLMRSSLRPAT